MFTITSSFSSDAGGSIQVIDFLTLGAFPSMIDEELARELEEPAESAQSTAKRVHGYKTRSGLLEDCTNVKVRGGRGGRGTKSIETRVEGYIDGSASYAKYIINGTGNRVADPFLREAIKDTAPEFERAIDKAISKAADKLVRGDEV